LQPTIPKAAAGVEQK